MRHAKNSASNSASTARHIRPSESLDSAAATEAIIDVEPSFDEAPEEPEHASVARSTALMSVATLGSRVTGLIRTWAMAFALGNTLVTSAYQIANTLPNAIYDLVAGGLLGAAFIPVYLLQKEKLGTESGNRFACTILNLVIVVMGALAILATVFAPQVISTQTFTVGGDAQVTEYSILFFRIFAAQIVFYGIGGVIGGILNANRIYFLPALAPAFNNIIVIASFFIYVPLSSIDPMLAIIVLAVGTTLGVVVQFAIQIPALIKMGFSYVAKIDLHDPALLEALKIALPTFVYIVGTLVSFSFRNAFSLQAGDDGPATLNYAWIWYQLPYGVVAVSLSRAMFTEMSEAVAREDWHSLRGHVRTGIAGTLLLIIPLAGLMGALSTPLMQLFQAGAFNAEDASYVASILTLWVVSLPFYSVLMYLYNTFASMRKFIAFAVVSCIMVVVQCALYALLCSPEVLGLAGVPIADLVYYGGCCAIMLIVLFRRIGSFNLVSILWMALRVLVATAFGVAVALGLSYLLPITESGMLAGLVRLALCGSVGLVVIFGLCALFRIPEMTVVTNVLKRVTGKFKKSRAPEEAELADDESFEARVPAPSENEMPRGRHARRALAPAPSQDHDDPFEATPLPPDATGAIMARARHRAPSDEALLPPDPSIEPPLPPDATGAIMKRARHIKQ